jgi:kynurenine formamidase
MRIMTSVDLSHPLHTAMPVYPGDPEVAITPATTIAAHGFNVLGVQMGSQSGTHIDAPYHFIDGGRRIDQYPPERFIGPVTIMDATGLPKNTRISADLVPAPTDADSLLIIHTGWSAHWGHDDYFSHPFLSVDAAEAIVAHGYKTIAIDALSVDQTDGNNDDFSAHMVLLGAEIPISENLTKVAAITWDDPWLSLLPIRIAEGDGAPVRAVALQFAHD